MDAGRSSQHTKLPERVFSTLVASSVAVVSRMMTGTKVGALYTPKEGCDWSVGFSIGGSKLFSDWLEAGAWQVGGWILEGGMLVSHWL